MLPEFYRHDELLGSHMPIDTTIHWNWHNPLTIIPLALFVVLVFSLVGTVIVILNGL
jgi:hypothetical protein